MEQQTEQTIKTLNEVLDNLRAEAKRRQNESLELGKQAEGFESNAKYLREKQGQANIMWDIASRHIKTLERLVIEIPPTESPATTAIDKIVAWLKTGGRRDAVNFFKDFPFDAFVVGFLKERRLRMGNYYLACGMEWGHLFRACKEAGYKFNTAILAQLIKRQPNIQKFKYRYVYVDATMPIIESRQ